MPDFHKHRFPWISKALISWYMRVPHKYRFVCYIQLGWDGEWKPAQCITSPFSDVNTSMCFMQASFCYEEFGELRISPRFKNVVIDHFLVHLCHHQLSFLWLIDSPLLYSVALMPPRNERIEKDTCVSAEKVIKLWLLLRDCLQRDIFFFNVFSFFFLRLLSLHWYWHITQHT